MLSHHVAQDENGTLFVATTPGAGAVPFWERMPLVPANRTVHCPIDASSVSVDRPAWAVDFYTLTPAIAQYLVDSYHS